VLLAAAAGVTVWAVNGRPSQEEVSRAVNPPPPPAVSNGQVTMRIWRKLPNGKAAKLRLSDPDAMPLYKGDLFRIEARTNVPAYLYLFWVNTEGKAEPVYPWIPGKWNTRPQQEAPLTELSLPPEFNKGFPIKGDKEGMETLLMLARPTPWALSDEEIRQLFAGLKPQRPVQDRYATVWFENGKIVERDPERTRQQFDTQRINDPVLELQEVLLRRLQPEHAAFTSAVSFAHAGAED
jgi:hypothetical protein